MARRASKAAAAHADHDMESSSGSEAEGFVEEGFEQSISDDEQGNSDEGPRVAQFMAESDLDDASSENESQEEESDTEGDGPSVSEFSKYACFSYVTDNRARVHQRWNSSSQYLWPL